MPARKPNAQVPLLLEPGTLWTKVIERTEHAKSCGALHLLPTQHEEVEQGGVNFLIRVLPSVPHKDEAKQKQDKETASSGKEFNPFLPYEEDLFVANISDTHLCLLNKFSIIDHHLLIITRSFEEQETWLTLRDFEAMWACLAEIDGLAFYNAGKNAGASQRHKHLQLVPLPLVPQGPKVPIEQVLVSASFQNDVGTIAGLPFVHAVAKLDFQGHQSPLAAASSTLACYHNLLHAVGLIRDTPVSGERHSGAYNLIVTRSWMLLVPRTSERFLEISVNSLGFAGTLVVRSFEQMKLIKEQGPMTVLRNVAVTTAMQA